MRRHSGSILLLALLLAIFFHDICFLGKTLSTATLVPGITADGPYGFSGHRPELPFSFDTGGNAWVNEPNPYIISKALDEGEVPSWNPREGLGMPLIANLNTEVFNPLKIFLNLNPGPFQQDIFFLLRLLVMGLFTYLFLKETKLSHPSSLLGSLFFMLSGYSVWWVNLHPLSTVMYLPAVFYFYERWSERKDLKSGFFMALFLSFAFAAGKTPDVIMGLCLLFPYSLWKGITKGSVRGLFPEGGKFLIATISGLLMASVVMLPFFELYGHASPLAKAIRTGAAGHTIPMITSVSLFQPLFLGWKNYFYASWIQWEPRIILPHASTVIMVLFFYAVLSRKTLLKAFPFIVFPVFIFSMVYGILPSHTISRLPVLGSIEFLKYNAMLYFSLSVMAASAFDDLLSDSGNKKRFGLSIAAVSLIIGAYFYALFRESPQEVRSYMTTVLVLSLCGMIALGLSFLLSKKRLVFGISVFLLLILELFLYMPKDHPDRVDLYEKPPYLKNIAEKDPYRIAGGGSSLPPLVSNAAGLYDIRSVSVLLHGDYYIFFENLLGFSVPQTNNPNPLFIATSPFADLTGVKYIMSREPLDYRQLGEEIRHHVTSLRWVRLFDAMITHTIKGGASYGFFDEGGHVRFSFFFPMNFAFETKLRVSEPFIFTGFALKDVPEGTTAKVKIRIGDDATELVIKGGGGWNDNWFDVSRHMGKILTIVMEGNGTGGGRVVLGDFGLSPGDKEEGMLYRKLLILHKKEFDSLDYRRTHEGINIYENKNVMKRAFLLRRVKTVDNLDDIINELQAGADFRATGLVDARGYGKLKASGIFRENGGCLTVTPFDKGGPGGHSRKVFIKKYNASEVSVEVESEGGLLVLSDLYYPGWKVKVDGKDEDMIKVFGVLRGVPVKSGKSEVIFTYRPVSLYVGAAISIATFVLWVFYLYAKRKKRI